MLKANSRTLPIEEIKVPTAFAQTTPGRNKVEMRKAFYKIAGKFDKEIIVDRKGYLFDGYSAYIAAKELGLDKVSVVQIVPFEREKKVDKPTEDKPKFKVGDRVKATDFEPKGEIGTVLGYEGSADGCSVLVEFDNWTKGHHGLDRGLHGKPGHCFFCFERYLEPYTAPSFDWDAFKAGKVAVHCDTEEKAKAFLKECEEHELKWWTSSDICDFVRTYLADKNGLWFAHDSDGLRWFSSVESKMPESRYTVIDYPFSERPEQPTEQKEIVKLYCVKYGASNFKRGNVYEVINETICFDDGSTGHFPSNFDEAKEQYPGLSACLVPLVKRPAKVGEWVYITHTDYAPEAGARLGVGDVCRVASVTPSGAKHLEVSPGYELSYYDREYLVLDGYHPEPEKEPEPEYYNGKVVCVKADGYFTVGKVYEFCNGLVKSNTGDSYNKGEPIESFGDLSDGTWVPKFIEYKGEAHD